MGAANALTRRERRVDVSVFTLFLNAVIQNAYALYRAIHTIEILHML